jgi:hypothetical protein
MVNENEMSDEEVIAEVERLLPNFVGNANASVITLAVCFGAFNRFLQNKGLDEEFVLWLDEDECLALILGTQIVAHPELYGDE